VEVVVASRGRALDQTANKGEGVKKKVVQDPQLGDKVRDGITGFEGVVTGVVAYISGCDQCLVVPAMKDEVMEMPKSSWIDVDRLSIVQEKVHSRRPVRVGSDASAPIK
jgi:hypothetical protein